MPDDTPQIPWKDARVAFAEEQAEACPPLTEEQIGLISTETERAATKALRRYRRPAVLGYVVLLLGLIIAFQQVESTRGEQRSDAEAQRHSIVQSGRAVSVDGCNRDFRTISALRAVLLASRAFQEAALKRGDITPVQFHRTTAFYNEQLARLQLPDCRYAKGLLTDNPGKKIVVPKPLFDPTG